MKSSRTVEPWLVIGAALYWGAIVVQFLFPVTASSPQTPLDDPLFKYLLLAAFVAVGFASPRLASTERGRRATLATMVCASLAASLLAASPFSPALSALISTCHLLAVTVLMVLWGFAFASMDKRRAGVNVTVTMLLAVLVALATLATSMFVPMLAMVRALMVVSACVLLSGRVRFCNVRRVTESKPDVRKRTATFLASRLAFGVVLGFGVEAPLHLVVADASAELLTLALVVTLAALTCALHQAGRLYFALPTLLLLTVGLTYLPFFEEGLTSFAEASVGLTWLVWAEFSAFQLSDLKERCGASELSLCLTEKLALSFAMVIGVAICRALTAIGVFASTEAYELVLMAGTCACTLGATYVTGRLVGERAEDRMREEMARTRREHTETVYDAIAAEHGLSAREREVMGMLAEGYTRAFIRDALGVSDGTAKAHIAHVYAKLDIHHKDDLLKYIDTRMSKA